MSGHIEISTEQFDRLVARVRRASHANLRPLLDAVGQQQEDAARKRITRTKRTPGGTRWKAWSRDYARTRGPQHSLLRDTGELADRMTHVEDVSAASVEVGSPMEYAGAHLFGKRARPYLDTDGGFADPHDRAELLDLLEMFIEGELLG